ncbi:3-hydroxyacyl-CoA dehydrogenase family protein [Amycolatopsis sp. K13G38]|uniref:3-hydroxyacyl-CoA dehydrogenase family protein n=1 Tax=Amycolatopsis acididurans TaxID=2724524 RepID=A0ABX1JFS1_9PSEU|nr:3-hydroxyacyl-CoA dehydrogenase family protein [Amycolatopsis acididurans]NKQ58046.1 3-hydroxyacyl-CoA dehydrogenase family protein [Amycolatopsis acididurans]
MAVEKITVVGGGGQMGSGIAQVAASAGVTVTIVDADEKACERGLGRIERSLARLVKAGKLTEDESAGVRGRIATTTDLESGCAEADYVIESVSEDLDLKNALLARIDASVPAHALISTNTSQIAISKLANAVTRPERFIGTHWFNPPPLMRLIEVVRGAKTSDETLQATLDLAKQLGKETIVCKKDTQGFITSRLMNLWCIEAARILEEGIADADDINRACVLAFNHAMGPLATADIGGLETVLAASESLTQNFGERFRPPQVLRTLVNAGDLGTKTGKGFSDYGEAR